MRGLRFALPCLPGLLGGCRDLQSALAPHGPDARQIAELSWVLFGGGAVVLTVVVGLVALAIRGSSTTRARLSGTACVAIGGLFVPSVVLTALLAYGLSLTRSMSGAGASEESLRIDVTGEQWWWRIGYPGPDGTTVWSANEIRVPVGTPVELTLRSADVIHAFWVPNLAGKVDMIPGRTARLPFAAETAGVFRGQCAEFCGGPHGLMALEVVAMPAPEFESWLRAQRAEAAEPSSAGTRRGRQLFLAAGCGGCHAVRGTVATGTIGPDLTHLRTRRHIGAALLPLTHANVARFIADGQHLKPGNRMPSFRILGDDDLAAIAGYLAEPAVAR